MGRLIDADKLSADMYHEAFEKDSDMQKWDSGCWIRYKMFENVLKAQPAVQPNTTTHDSITAETGKNDGDGTSGDCISRQVVAKFLDDWLFCLDENCHKQSASDLKMIIKDFKNLPSAQPERLTDDDFETIRIHLNAYKEKLCNQQRWEEAEEYQRIIDRFMAFASAQSEPEAVFEWKKEFKEHIESLDITRDEWKGIIEYIDELPSVQLNHNAEVSKMGIVHCEDCEHWDTSWETAYGLHYCHMIDMSTKKNFFCKYGAEKRGEIDETD